MGLLNIYQIRSMRPHINYRFKCDIWEYAGTFLNIDEVNCFSFAVKKVKLPTFKLDTDNKISFGNTAYVIPTINFGALRQTQRSPEGPRHLHRIPRLSEGVSERPA